MPEIKVLPKNIAELIAAGEVVERPSAVIKELVENSIDAGATEITVEIKRGGILYMSVRDNGCGITPQDVPTAFMRHATSKITHKDDLDRIATLGFRGEALAAVSAVSKTEIITRTQSSEIGTHCIVEGSVQTVLEEIGCEKGTFIIVKDIFYNTPARMKFLKSDVAEGNNIAAVVDRIALSHPEISFKFIRDGRRVLTTSGDGNLKNVIYSVLGREFASSLIDVSNNLDGVSVTGMICKPVYCKQNRNGQFFFLNGRLIKSNTAAAALEQAYKNSAMTGKFPCCVLQINVPFDTVDVNVHPTKMEVRFSDERKIFNAVYYAVKSGLQGGDTRPEVKVKTTFNPYSGGEPPKYTQTRINDNSAKVFYNNPVKPERDEKTEGILISDIMKSQTDESDIIVFHAPETTIENGVLTVHTAVGDFQKQITEPDKTPEKPQISEQKSDILPVKAPAPQSNEVPAPQVRYIGYAFNTYIIAEMDNAVYFIDKHAAHERLLYEQLKSTQKIEVQELLVPLTVTLTKEEYGSISSNIELLAQKGFDVDDFGGGTVVVRAVPAVLFKEDIALIITELADSLIGTGNADVERIDDIFHTVACKAAIKGGQYNTDYELKALAERILSFKDIMYCPHGRPVAFKLTRHELEKQFGRLG